MILIGVKKHPKSTIKTVKILIIKGFMRFVFNIKVKVKLLYSLISGLLTSGKNR